MNALHTDNAPPALAEQFRLGDWIVDPTLDRIFRNDEEVHIEPRVMSVLTLLAAQPGNVMSRESLESGAWGKVVVGYDSLSGCINKLRKALGDNPQNPRYIETVSKKGYRLIAPVSADVKNGAITTSDVMEAGTGKLSRPVKIIIAAVIGLGIVATSLLSINRFSADTSLETVIGSKKRIAVLPFTNLSDDPSQDFFVEGITDNLITDLSNFSGFVVVAGSASSQYSGNRVSPVEAGKQLGADYLVQGSVRKSGNDLQMNVNLVNTSDGTNVWARRYKNNETGLFGMQDEVTREIVNSLSLRLSSQDAKRLSIRPTNNFEAYELFLLGQKQFKVRTKESNEAAQEYYRQAIRLDPVYARAYGALAVALDVNYFRGWSESPTSTLDRALEMAKYAVELDPGSPQARWALGYTHLFRREEQKAVEEVEKAVELAPNYADGYGLLALINNYLGNAEDAANQVKKGMLLNPHYSWDYPYNLGRAYYHLGEYKKAIETLNQALDRNEYARNPRLFLIASYMAIGNKEDAAWEVEKIIANSPETTVSHLEKNYPISADKKLLETFLDQLRQAGLPE